MPTVLRWNGFRFYFYSHEGTEPPHIHVDKAGNTAKFWLDPEIELAGDYGLGRRSVTTALRLIREHEDEIRAAWKKHFRR